MDHKYLLSFAAGSVSRYYFLSREIIRLSKKSLGQVEK